MIALSLPARFSDPSALPFVLRCSRAHGTDATLVGEFAGAEIYQRGTLTIEVTLPPGDSILGDVVFADPSAGRISRWIRSGSVHNTLLVTERCDQLCIMCSQPPKKTHTDLFSHFLEACVLAPQGTVIGLSGGEPLLYKRELFDLVERTAARRPDIRFHILTNGQHFDRADIARLSAKAFEGVQWGIPLYAADPGLHDDIVGKPGAQARLRSSLAVLAEAGQDIELRTVLVRQNYDCLPELARWVTAHLPFISVWALMQLERAGFARKRWSEQFVDHSGAPRPLIEAVTLAKSRGQDVALYNFPYCTVPDALRPFLVRSISDWKRAFPSDCESCRMKSECGGFFEWHASLKDYARGGAL